MKRCEVCQHQLNDCCLLYKMERPEVQCYRGLFSNAEIADTIQKLVSPNKLLRNFGKVLQRKANFGAIGTALQFSDCSIFYLLFLLRNSKRSIRRFCVTEAPFLNLKSPLPKKQHWTIPIQHISPRCRKTRGFGSKPLTISARKMWLEPSSIQK